MKSRLNIAFASMLAIGLLSIGFQACKKGADDPFLSLRSRKARVVGDWRIAQAKLTSTTTETLTNGSQTTTETTLETDAGKTTTTTSVSGFPVEVKNSDEETTYSFSKDGTWTSEKTVVTTFIDTTVIGFNNDYYQQTTVTNTVTESNGTWNFLGGVGDAKNKENLSLQTIASKETSIIDRSFVAITPGATAFPAVKNTVITENEYATSLETWQLTELRNKAMAVSRSGKDRYSKTVNGSQSGSITETTTDATQTLEAK